MSSETFSSLDHHLWELTYRWAFFRHNDKPKRWIITPYFGQFHPARKDR